MAVYLPPKIVSTSAILNGCTRPMTFPMEEFTGIRNRRMAGESEYSIDLARKAAADCLDRSRRRPAEIGLIICCNISRFDAPQTVACEPSTAVKLRHHFGLTNAIAFDLTNGCAGMF